jgi:two-component system chemotaxis sensor kinase CheA
MSDQYTDKPVPDTIIFEASYLLNQLEQSILRSEKDRFFTTASINEIFRIIHTIKGSSAMMMFDNITTLAHTMEDLFYYLREEKPMRVDSLNLADLLLDCVDFIKIEMENLKNSDPSYGETNLLIAKLNYFLSTLKRKNSTTVMEDLINKQQYFIKQDNTITAI